MSRRVLLVYPKFPSSYWGFQYALRMVGRKSMHSPLSIITVAALCPQDWEYKLVDLNIEPLTDESILWADTVFLTAMSIQSDSLFETLERCRRLGRQTVLGGPLASGCPERCAGKADVMVLDEGEITIPAFLADLERGTLKPVYRADHKPDISTSPVPRFDLLELDAYSVIDVQYSRGCPFNCEFCDIISLYGRVPRTKTPQQIIAEFDRLRSLGFSGMVFLVDDNFIGNKKNVRILLKEVIAWQTAHNYPLFLTTEASVNLAEDRPLLDDMRRAGFNRVFLGIETPSLDSLKETQKYQNTRKNLVDAVHTVIESGLEVTAGFIVGFDSDRPDIFDAQIAFIAQAEIPWAMVGTLSAIPTTQLWARLEKEGRLLGYSAGDQFGRPNFKTRMDGDVLYSGYLRILRTVYDPATYYARVLASMDRQQAAKLPPLRRKKYALHKVLSLLTMAILAIGIKATYRLDFWRFLLAVTVRYPHRLMQALINAVIGHHFIRYTSEVMVRQRELTPLIYDAETARAKQLAAPAR